MATKKAGKKKTTRKKKKDNLADDPPILVGGGGSTLTSGTFVKLPAGTPKTATSGGYDVYRVPWDVRTILTKLKKNGTSKKDKPEDDGWQAAFWKTDV